MTGRGWGKNTVGSHFAHAKAAAHPGRAGFLAARTKGDVSKVIIGHPESGLLVTQDPRNPCTFKRHEGIVRWANGAYAEVQTSEEPEGGRGPHYAWGFADEIGTWKRTADAFGLTLWENLDLATRAGPHPQIFAASTPRYVALVRQLLADAKDASSGVVLATGTLLDNAANLAPSYVRAMLRKYKGSRLERQEILGELLADLVGAILTLETINANRVEIEDVPEIARYMIGCDPALKKKKKSDKTGINVSGRGIDEHLYSFEDRSDRMSPNEWGSELVRLSAKYDNAPIVAEDNVIGEAIETIIFGCVASGQPRPRVIRRTAKASKAKRAEPILAYHERGEAHFVGTDQKATEDQLCQFTATGWEGEGSPDEADANVWAATELMLGERTTWDEAVAANA